MSTSGCPLLCSKLIHGLSPVWVNPITALSHEEVHVRLVLFNSVHTTPEHYHTLPESLTANGVSKQKHTHQPQPSHRKLWLAYLPTTEILVNSASCTWPLKHSLKPSFWWLNSPRHSLSPSVRRECAMYEWPLFLRLRGGHAWKCSRTWVGMLLLPNSGLMSSSLWQKA